MAFFSFISIYEYTIFFTSVSADVKGFGSGTLLCLEKRINVALLDFVVLCKYINPFKHGIFSYHNTWRAGELYAHIPRHQSIMKVVSNDSSIDKKKSFHPLLVPNTNVEDVDHLK